MITLEQANQARAQSGLTPLTQLGAQPQAPTQSLVDRLGLNTPKPTDSNTISIGKTPIVGGAAGGFIHDIQDSLKNRSDAIISDITRPAEMRASGASPLSVLGATGEAGLRTVGNVAGSVFDIANAGIKAITPSPVKNFLSGVVSDFQKGNENNPDTSGAQLISHIAGAWNDVTQAHPELTKDAGAVMNIIGLLGAPKAIGETGKILSDVKQGASDLIDSGVNKVKGLVEKGTNVISKDPLQDSLETIKPKLTPTEEAAAKEAGRGKTSGILKTTSIQPTKTELEMAQYAKDAGIKSSNTFDENIKLAKQAQQESATKLRSGLENSDAIWNKNDVKGILDKVERPLTIKSDTTLSKLANNFKKSVVELAQQANKKAVGILDLRQNLDTLIDKEFPANIYTKDTPIGQYVRNVRQALNSFAESTLPDGKLPDGSTFKGEMRKQSLFYDAIENMATKAPKEGTNLITRGVETIKNHPVVSSIGALGAAYEIGKHGGL